MGDANLAEDPWDVSGVPPSSIVGVYQYTLPTPAGTSDARYNTHTYPNLGDSRSQANTIHVNAADNNGMASFQTVTETVSDFPPPVPAAPDTILGLSPTLFYTSVGVAIAVILTLGVVVALQRKRRLFAKSRASVSLDG